MSRRALALLARLERAELEREQRALASAQADLVRTEAGVAAREAAFGGELMLALEMPGGAGLAAGHAVGHRRQQARLRAECRRLGSESQRLGTALQERAIALRTLELAAADLKAKDDAVVAQAEQKRLDDAAVIRHVVSGRYG
jgi:hypothetical protein